MPYCRQCEEKVPEDVEYISDVDTESEPFVVFNDIEGVEEYYCENCMI